MFVFLGKYMIHDYNPEPMQMMACLRCGIYVGSVLCRGSTTMPQAGVWTNWIGSAPRCLQKQHYWSHWRTEMTKFVVLLMQDGCWNMLKQVSAPVQPLSHVVTMCLRWAHWQSSSQQIGLISRSLGVWHVIAVMAYGEGHRWWCHDMPCAPQEEVSLETYWKWAIVACNWW